MSNPFFLTRQSANLMEDFVRELNQGSALFLLYGETGVGKTRLLQELAQSRLADHAIYWLDLDSEDGSEETRMDRSAEVEALFAAAGSGDIIIADHFEMALKKTRHQLFLSWSTDGIDKQLNLLIASNKEGFNELRQLSQQYGVRVQSFEQMPFSPEEIQSFLGFYLFPDHPVGKLTIPSPLRKQISSTQGVVGRLIEIADREGQQIKSEPITEVETIRQGSRVIVYVVALLVLLAGVAWYLLREPALLEPPPITLNVPATESPVVVEPSPLPQETAAQETAVTMDAGQSIDAAGQAEQTEIQAQAGAELEEQQDASAAETGVSAVSTETPVLATSDSAQPADFDNAGQSEAVTGTVAIGTITAESENGNLQQVTAQQESRSDQVEMDEFEPGVMPESEAVLEAPAADESNQPVITVDDTTMVAQSSEKRFESMLGQSMDWINARDDRVGTVQILLLSYENFDPDNYYEYIDRLAARDVDVEQIRVFKTLTGKREVYSVVYGEFASRKAALGAIEGLPEALRETSPLARSVGGLWQEIRRLDSQN